MSDDADRAKETEELTLLVARTKRKPTLLPIGHCYNCDETIKIGLFCDADCREDYEKRTR